MAADGSVTQTAHFSGITFSVLAERLRITAAERGLAISETTEGLCLTTPIGTLDFAPQDKAIRLVIAAPDANSAQMIRDGAVEALVTGTPEIARTLSWEGVPEAGTQPSNFRFANVASVAPVASDFLRVRITGENLKPFAGDRMHFRLALPQPGDTSPDWPTVDDSGRTIWPEGDKTLHRPVYTVIDCDPVAGWLEFDVFVHDGGRVTEWARHAATGDLLGIIGPGGAKIETARHMLLGGDETAYPAIARTLAKLPPDATGDLVLLSENGATDYPFDPPRGFRVTHLARGHAPGLVDTFRQLGPPEDGFLWAGAERDDAMALREHFRAGLGWEKDRSYMAAFWTRA